MLPASESQRSRTESGFTPDGSFHHLPGSSQGVAGCDNKMVIRLAQTPGNEADCLTFAVVIGGRHGLADSSATASDLTPRPAGQPDRQAAEAVALLGQSLVRHAGALIADMGGIDAPEFTAGIGERSPAIRARGLQVLGLLGLDADLVADDVGATIRNHPDSRFPAAMIPTDAKGVILHALLPAN